MRRVLPGDLVVTGAWCVTPLGSGPDALHRGWADGTSALGPIRRFATATHRSLVGGEMPDPPAPWPGGLRGAAHLDECVVRAVERSGLPRGTRAAVIVATTKGFLDAGVQVEGRHAAHEIGAPALRVADVLRRRLGWHVAADGDPAGPVTVSMACASGTAAIALAAARAPQLAELGIDAVIVAGIDLLSDFVVRGFAALGAIDPEPCRPFDVGRAGMSPAESAAAIVLEFAGPAGRRGAPALGAVLGWGLANDAAHPTAPARDGAGMIRAIRSAMRRADAEPSDLGHVHAHGTGTQFNDAMEVRALREVLGADAARVPVTTTKGTIGHGFGATGLVEVIASLEAVRCGVLPAIHGLREPEPGLRFVQVPEALRSPAFLRMGAGFGGFDAAVVMGAAAVGGGEGNGPHAHRTDGVTSDAGARGTDPDVVGTSAGGACPAPTGRAATRGARAMDAAGSRRGEPIRCRVAGGLLRTRIGRGPWRPAGTVAELVGALPPSQRERAARLDPTSRAAVAAVATVLRCLAVESPRGAEIRSVAGHGPALHLGGVPVPAEDVVWWAATEDGSAAADVAYWETARTSGGALASPQKFAATLPSAVAGDVALVLGLRGEGIVTTGGRRPRGGVSPWAHALVAGDAVPHLGLWIARHAAGIAPRATAVLRAHRPGMTCRDGTCVAARTGRGA